MTLWQRGPHDVGPSSFLYLRPHLNERVLRQTWRESVTPEPIWQGIRPSALAGLSLTLCFGNTEEQTEEHFQPLSGCVLERSDLSI